MHAPISAAICWQSREGKIDHLRLAATAAARVLVYWTYYYMSVFVAATIYACRCVVRMCYIVLHSAAIAARCSLLVCAYVRVSTAHTPACLPSRAGSARHSRYCSALLLLLLLLLAMYLQIVLCGVEF